MSSEVGSIPLRELSSRITKGTTPTKGEGFVDCGINYIKSESISADGSIDASKFAFIDVETHNKLSRSQLRPGNVLFSMAGVYLGKTAVVLSKHLPANTNQAVGIITLDESKADPYFIHYSLQSPACRAWILRSAAQSAQPNFNLQEIGDLKIPTFPLAQQKEIASVLCMLDDRITLLRETNTTLEAIAQALFKSWFVDYDPVYAKMQGRAPEVMDEATAALFPDSFEESELGDVPKGWSISSVADVTQIVKGKSYSSKDLVGQHTTALVTLKSFERGGGFRMDGFKPYSGTFKPSQVVTPGDLIVAYTDVTQAAELIGKPAIVVGIEDHDTLVASLDVGIVRPDDSVCGSQFLYGLFKTDSFQSHTLARTSGTTVLHLSKDGVGSYQFALPSSGVIKAFEDIATQLAERRQINSDQVRLLSLLRDTLLPRLISGQLRTSDTQAIAESLA